MNQTDNKLKTEFLHLKNFLSEQIKIIESKNENALNIHVKSIIESACHHKWFTKTGIIQSIKNTGLKLNKHELNFKAEKHFQIAIILNNDYPLQALESILLSIAKGYRLILIIQETEKNIWINLQSLLADYFPIISTKLQISEKLLKSIDAIICYRTGICKNLKTHFPHIPLLNITQKRSIAILDEKIDDKFEKHLTEGILLHFGRNPQSITKILIPKNFKIETLFAILRKHSKLTKDHCQHHRYLNNYGYWQSVYLMENIQHFDNGFLLISENRDFFSPTSVLFYEIYKTQEALNSFIKNQSRNISEIINFSDKIKIDDSSILNENDEIEVFLNSI